MTVKSNLGRKATYVGPPRGGLPTGTTVTVIAFTLGAVPLAVVKLPSGHDVAVPYDTIEMTGERT